LTTERRSDLAKRQDLKPKRQGLDLTGMKGIKGISEPPELSYVIPGRAPAMTRNDRVFFARLYLPCETLCTLCLVSFCRF